MSPHSRSPNQNLDGLVHLPEWFCSRVLEHICLVPVVPRAKFNNIALITKVTHSHTRMGAQDNPPIDFVIDVGGLVGNFLY